MTELREMPSSLNDACRKLDVAYAEIERLRAAMEEIKLKGVTTGYGRVALAYIARDALNGTYQHSASSSSSTVTPETKP